MDHGNLNAHWKMAVQLFESPRIPPGYDITHLGWQWAVIFSHAILGHSWQMNAVLVTLGTVLLTVGIMFWMLAKTALFLTCRIAFPRASLFCTSGIPVLGGPSTIPGICGDQQPA